MMLKPYAKQLRHPIVLLEDIAQNEMEAENWQQKFTIYADIQSVCDSKFGMLENLNFDHVITEALFLFKTRFRAEVNSKMRIVFRTRLFEIKRVINLRERNQWLQIIALEIL